MKKTTRTTEKDLLVHYKYVIHQPIAIENKNKAISKWLSYGPDFLKVGGRGLFVSPIYFSQKTSYYVQVHMDIDNAPLSKISENEWKNFLDICNSKQLFPVFSGKEGFHVYSLYLIKIPYNKVKSTKDIRQVVWNKVQVSPEHIGNVIGGKVDVPLSTTKQPVPRVGWRHDTKKFIVPVLPGSALHDLTLLKSIVASEPDDLPTILDKYINIATYVTNFVVPSKTLFV